MQQIIGKDLKDFVKAYVGNAMEPEATSLTIRLSKRFWIEKLSSFTYTLDKEDCNPAMEFVETDSLLVSPKEFILADAMETFFMPSNARGVIALRSYAAQRALEQSSSFTLKPDWCGNLKFELVNEFRYHPIRLVAGEPIASVEFFRFDSELEAWEQK